MPYLPWGGLNPNQAGVSESLIRQGEGGGGPNGPQEKLIGHIFAFHATKIFEEFLGQFLREGKKKC